MDTEALITFVTAMFAILNPIGNVAIFAGIAPNLEMSAVCVVLAALLSIGFLAAGSITRVLGTKGMDIVTKLMAMILLAIAVGMLASGLKGLLPGLAGVTAGQ